MNTNRLCFLPLLICVVLSGCQSAPKPRGRTAVLDVPFVKQEKWYCGAAAISAHSRFYGRCITQYEVASKLFSRKRGGIINIHMNMFMREKGFWTKTLVLTDYTTEKIKKENTCRLLQEIKKYIDRGHPVIALIGPVSKNIFGMSFRVFVGPFFYVSDYEDMVQLNHYVLITGYDDDAKVFVMHNGQKPNVRISYRMFSEKWKKVDCWALVAVPPLRIEWELSPEEMLDAGLILEQQEQYLHARAYYKKALERAAVIKNPEKKKELEFRILFNTANVHLALGDYDASERILTSLQDKAGETGPLLNNLAEVYLNKKVHIDRAQAMVLKAIKKDSDNMVYYLDTQAMIFLERGDTEKARILLEQAMDIAPNKDTLSVLHYHMGKTYQTSRNFKKAFYHFRIAVDSVDEEKMPKRESEYTLRYALCGLMIGKKDKAIEGFQKVIALDRGPLSLEARENLLNITREPEKKEEPSKEK